MFFNGEVYDEVWGTISKEDDEYTEYLANFEESCENESGRFVVASVTSVGPCAAPLSFISQPTCLAKSSCGYEESRVAEEFIWGVLLDIEGCGEDVVTVTLEEEFGSKSSKSSKKSKKCEKSNKVPKSRSLRKGRK